MGPGTDRFHPVLEERGEEKGITWGGERIYGVKVCNNRVCSIVFLFHFKHFIDGETGDFDWGVCDLTGVMYPIVPCIFVSFRTFH